MQIISGFVSFRSIASCIGYSLLCVNKEKVEVLPVIEESRSSRTETSDADGEETRHEKGSEPARTQYVIDEKVGNKRYDGR